MYGEHGNWTVTSITRETTEKQRIQILWILLGMKESIEHPNRTNIHCRCRRWWMMTQHPRLSAQIVWTNMRWYVEPKENPSGDYDTENINSTFNTFGVFVVLFYICLWLRCTKGATTGNRFLVWARVYGFLPFVTSFTVLSSSTTREPYYWRCFAISYRNDLPNGRFFHIWWSKVAAQSPFRMLVAFTCMSSTSISNCMP